MLSFRKRFATLGDTIQAYPIATVILCAICVLTLVVVRERVFDFWPDQLQVLQKLLMISLVYVFVSVAVTKRFTEEPKRHILRQWVLLVAMVAYFFVLPAPVDNAPQTLYIRHAIIQITAIITLLVLPLRTKKRNEQSMYHGVIQLFLHAALAGIFSLVLAWGIMWALWWIEQLFGVTVVSEWYPTIMAVVWILFGGLSFLDGIRQWKIDEDEPVQQVKRKTMLGRVVGFLLLVYGVILYIYLGKILVTWERPSNQVTPLSFAFSWLVVLWSILLIPLVTDEKDTVVRKRALVWMYLAVLPILVMVFFAIKLRLSQYGITEMRYIVCALLLRLVVSTGYMIISKQKDLWWVAMICTIIAFISFAGGPLSASWMAKNYQEKRLETFIATHHLQGGTGLLDKTAVATLKNSEQQELAGLIVYSISFYGPATMSKYYAGSIENEYNVLDKLWLEAPLVDFNNNNYLYISSEGNISRIDTTWYTALYRGITLSTYNDAWNWGMIAVDSWVTAYIDWPNVILTIAGSVHTIGLDSLVAQFRNTATSNGPGSSNLPSGQFVFSGAWFKLFFSYISGQFTADGTFSLESMWFDLLVE